MTVDDALLARITARVREDKSDAGPPAPLSASEIRDAEKRLGFALPPLLATLYREIGNGGFGPAYQLLALSGGSSRETAVEAYLSMRGEGRDTPWAWPEGVLPILDWGCAMYMCVDCRSEAGTVLLFDPNSGDPQMAWYVDAPSLDAWFARYLAGAGWWEGDADDDLAPWDPEDRHGA